MELGLSSLLLVYTQRFSSTCKPIDLHISLPNLKVKNMTVNTKKQQRKKLTPISRLTIYISVRRVIKRIPRVLYTTGPNHAGKCMFALLSLSLRTSSLALFYVFQKSFSFFF